MEVFLLVGLILICTYILGQVSFVIYSKRSYAKLRNAIISQGRLISMIPVLTVTTVMQGSSQNQFQPMPGAPPGYSVNTETKQMPPAYTP